MAKKVWQTRELFIAMPERPHLWLFLKIIYSEKIITNMYSSNIFAIYFIDPLKDQLEYYSLN